MSWVGIRNPMLYPLELRALANGFTSLLASVASEALQRLYLPQKSGTGSD